MEDVDAAGDIPAVLNRLKGPIKDSATVGVLSIADLAAGGDIRNHEVIRSREDAYHAEGGITALKGNIAHSAIIKQTVVDSDMLAHTGPAKVYHSGKALLDAAEAKRITEGDVLVVPYQEPAGAPACRKC